MPLGRNIGYEFRSLPGLVRGRNKPDLESYFFRGRGITDSGLHISDIPYYLARIRIIGNRLGRDNFIFPTHVWREERANFYAVKIARRICQRKYYGKCRLSSDLSRNRAGIWHSFRVIKSPSNKLKARNQFHVKTI